MPNGSLSSSDPPAGMDAARTQALVSGEVSGRRIQQVIAVIMLAMLAIVTPDLVNGRWSNVAVILMGEGMLAAALVMSHLGRQATATKLLLIGIMAVVMVMTWRNSGLYDTGMLAFPCVLLFGAVLASGRFFALMFIVIEVFIAVMCLGGVKGWYVSVPTQVDGRMLLDFSAIIGAIGSSAWLLAKAQRRATRELAAQNRRVVDLQKHTQWMATHDALTSLPNRVLAHDRFDVCAAEARRVSGRVAMLYLDLDNFKHINDTMGHACGDALLKDVGGRLRGLLRESDTVCRLGGDEFLILLRAAGEHQAVGAIAANLVRDLAEPVTLQGMEVLTGASIGIALFPDDGEDFEGLLKRADLAMYRVKTGGGRNGYRFYDDEMHTTVVEHVQLVSAMRTAVDAGTGFRLVYQPQYELQSGRLVGAEALLRWWVPTLGFVPPTRFIPLAEHSGLIARIGDWVLMEACRQAQAWRQKGWTDLVISVNVSPVQFLRCEIEGSVHRALQSSGLPPSCLELELTESLFIQDSPHLAEGLGRLRALGLRFAIDDFGTGYSNLGYLKRFEVERLKIDQSFIRRIAQDEQDKAIVRAIVQMSSGLGLSTIAEGVEDDGALNALRAIGCVQGQGFYWHPGLSPEEFEGHALGGEMCTSVRHKPSPTDAGKCAVNSRLGGTHEISYSHHDRHM